MANWENPQNFAIWLAIVIFIFVVLSFSLVYIVRVYLSRIYTEREKAQQIKLEHQKSLVRDSIVIQEKERERIAADLHDDLISKLNSLKFLTYHEQDLPIKEIQTQIENSIKLTRNISHDLCPPLIEESSILDLFERILTPFSHKIEISITSSGYEYDKILKENKLQLCRIIQEVINNILKHSKASETSLHIKFGEKYFIIYITDNGVGYDTKAVSSGLGKKNVLLRAEYLNAMVNFKSVIGKGSSFLLITNRINI